MKRSIEPAGTSFSGSSVVLFLKALSKSELREFEKFVQSLFHNNRSDVTRFFAELKKYYPSFDQKNFSKQEVFKLLYPKTKYKDDVIRRLSSNLLKLGEEYGAYKVFRNNKFEYDKSLTEFYLIKSSVSPLEKQLKKTEAALEQQPFRDANYFLNVNFLEEYKRLYQVRVDSSGGKIDIQKQMDSIWKFTAITLFRLYKVASAHEAQFNKKYNTAGIELILKYINENGFMGSKALEVWYLIIKFRADTRNDETFYRLKELIAKNVNIFEPVEGFIIYLSLLSYCFDMNSIPSKDFRKDEFELMRHMLKGGLMVQDGVFHPEWFIYACITSLRAGQIRFAESLIEDHKNSLPEKERNNALNHAYAELEIEKGNFEKALSYLALPKYNNVAEKLRANHMYIKIYYELGMSEQFFYNIDSFRHLIKNEASLNKEIKTIRENFIKYTVKLFRLKIKEIDTPAEEIRREILNSKILGNKWLLEKVKELEQKNLNRGKK